MARKTEKERKIVLSRRESGGVSLFVFFSLLISFVTIITGAVIFSLFQMRLTYLNRNETDHQISMAADSLRTRLAGPLAINDLATIDHIMKDGIGTNWRVTDAFITKDTGNTIIYDLSGSHEDSQYSDSFHKPGSKYITRPIVINGSVGFHLPRQVTVGRLVVGYNYSDIITSEHIRSLYTYAEPIYREITSDIENNRIDQVRIMLVDVMRNNRNIIYAKWVAPDRTILLNLYRNPRQHTISGPEGHLDNSPITTKTLRSLDKRPISIHRTTDSFERPVIDIALSLRVKNLPSGAIRLGYSPSHFTKSSARYDRMFYGITALFFLISLLFGILAAYLITTPLKKLSETAHKALAGDLDQRHGFRSGFSEILNLANTLEALYAQRKRIEADLIEHESHLHTLSQTIISAQEHERAAIARELHDELGHRLSTLALELEWLKKQPAPSHDDISRAASTIETASAELVRIYRGISPHIISRFGLTSAIESFINEIRPQISFDMHLDLAVIDRHQISPDAALNTYRIFQESLTNIIKHANASRVTITLTATGDTITLRITDDGAGFPRDSHGGGIGLLGMRERALICGGTLDIESHPGHGTAITLTLPNILCTGDSAL